MNGRTLFSVIIIFILSGCIAKTPITLNTSTPESSAVVRQEILSYEEIVLKGHDVLEIIDSDYVQHHNIILKDHAILIIDNSTFEHLHNYSFQYELRAYDQARVIVKNATIRSSAWLNWFFHDESSLVMEDVKNRHSAIWHAFMGSARAQVNWVDKFWATMNEQVVFDIANTAKTFIEVVYPVGAIVNEALPRSTTDYRFPNEGEQGIRSRLKMRNTQAAAWGITVNPGGQVTIEDTDDLVVTFHIAKPYRTITAEFSELRVKHYADQTWQVANGDIKLRLLNTRTRRWSPIVSGRNKLIVRDSDIADNAFSYGAATAIYEQCTIRFLRANDRVRMTIKDSVVQGDVVAKDNSRIRLINTRVSGQIVEEDNGKVDVINTQ